MEKRMGRDNQPGFCRTCGQVPCNVFKWKSLWFYEHHVKDNFSLEGCAIGGKQMREENTGEGVDCYFLVKKKKKN